MVELYQISRVIIFRFVNHMGVYGQELIAS